MSILELSERHTKSRAHRDLVRRDEVARNSRELSFWLEIFSICNLCWAKDSIRTKVLGDYWKEHTISMEDCTVGSLSPNHFQLKDSSPTFSSGSCDGVKLTQV